MSEGDQTKTDSGVGDERLLSAGNRLIWWLVLFQVLVVVYLPSLRGPFVYDDIASIVDNPDLREPGRPWLLLRDHGTSLLFDRRPVGGLVTLVNFQFSGLNPLGYRIVNLLLHWITAGVLAELVILSGGLLRVRGIRGVAIASATLWALHPLNTMPVAYIYQRMEILMSLFLAAALYCVLRAGREAGGRRWLIAAWFSAMLSFLSKEVAVLLPLILLLAERICVWPDWRSLLAGRWRFYGTLAAGWVPAMLWFAGGARTGDLSVGDALSTPWGYFRAQCHVLVDYLKLVIWPDPLVFFRAPRYPTQLSHWLPQGFLLAGLAGLAWNGGRNRPWIWLLALVFFLTLAPTSSLIPIAVEPAAEFRMYLPSFCVIVLLVAAAVRCHRPLGLGRGALLGGLALVATALAMLSHERSAVYADRALLWKDVLAKEPDNTKAWLNYGGAEADAGNTEAARQAARGAVEYGLIRGKQTYSVERILTLADMADGLYDEAEAHARKAIELEPDEPQSWLDLAEVLVGQERNAEALALLGSREWRPEDTLRAARIRRAAREGE